MAGYPVLSPNFPDLYDLRFRAENYIRSYADLYPPRFAQVFDVQYSTLAAERTSSIAGYKELDQIGENEDFPLKSLVEGYDKTFTHSYYADKISVSLIARQDDPKGFFSGQRVELQTRAHMEAAMYTFENACASIIRKGFDSTTTPDAQYLFDTDHPQSPDNTATIYSNVITTPISGNGTALDAMYQKIAANCYDQAGHPLQITNWVLLVPPVLKKKAIMECRALYGDVATSTHNIMPPNPFGSGDMMGPITVLEWPFLGSAFTNGSDTAWYMIANPSDFNGRHSLRFYWRVEPTVMIDGVEPTINQDNGAFQVPIIARASQGALDWRHCWGSTGLS